MNKVILLGRLTKDVELKYTQTSNTPVSNFTIAVDRKYEKDKADFFNIVTYGKLAEVISKYIKKGQEIVVAGRLQTRNYDDKDGKRVYVTEVIADEVDFTSNKKEETKEEFTPVTDDDLPF